MAVPTKLADLSTTAGSNAPGGSESIGTSLDDYLRGIQAIIKQDASIGSPIASTGVMTLPDAGSYFLITGTTTINSFADSWNGRKVTLKFSGALTLTHSASLILPGGVNVLTVAGDTLDIVNESTGVYRVTNFMSYSRPVDSDFVAGTKMVFYQDAAPTGWTRDNTKDDYMLRTVSGTGGGSGGSASPITAHTHTVASHVHTGPSHSHTIDSTALSTAQMPAHTHNVESSTGANNVALHTSGVTLGSDFNAVVQDGAGTNVVAESAGGGTGHTHGMQASGTANTGGKALTTDSGFTPKYLNMIIAVKD